MRTARAALLLTPSVLALISCSHALTPSLATDAIRADLATTSAGLVEVKAISDSGRYQAIARATITGKPMRLRFRRYDDGWVWEAAESGTGSWVAASEIVKQVREAARQEKAMQWATHYRDDYVSTVRLLDRYTEGLPRRLNSSFPDVNWPAHGREDRTPGTSTIRGVRAPAVEDPPDRDAWGSQILWAFHASERTATFVSAGPDKTIETSDDVVLQVVGETMWDDVDKQPIYKYSKRWSVPEGLESATRAAAGMDTVEIHSSRVVIK